MGYLHCRQRLFQRLVGLNASQFSALFSRVEHEMQPPFTHDNYPLVMPISEARKVARWHPSHVSGEVMLLPDMLQQGISGTMTAGKLTMTTTRQWSQQWQQTNEISYVTFRRLIFITAGTRLLMRSQSLDFLRPVQP